jgi:hypothetical protein
VLDVARVTGVIRRRFTVDCTLARADLLLHRIGWSVQVPARRTAERDEARIAAWREAHARFEGRWRYAPPSLPATWLPTVLMWVAAAAHAWAAVAALLLVVLLQSAMCAARDRARRRGGTTGGAWPCRPKQRRSRYRPSAPAEEDTVARDGPGISSRLRVLGRVGAAKRRQRPDRSCWPGDSLNSAASLRPCTRSLASSLTRWLVFCATRLSRTKASAGETPSSA